jgi:hypothetical protein
LDEEFCDCRRTESRGFRGYGCDLRSAITLVRYTWQHHRHSYRQFKKGA